MIISKMVPKSIFHPNLNILTQKCDFNNPFLFVEHLDQKMTTFSLLLIICITGGAISPKIFGKKSCDIGPSTKWVPNIAKIFKDESKMQFLRLKMYTFYSNYL